MEQRTTERVPGSQPMLTEQAPPYARCTVAESNPFAVVEDQYTQFWPFTPAQGNRGFTPAQLEKIAAAGRDKCIAPLLNYSSTSAGMVPYGTAHTGQQSMWQTETAVCSFSSCYCVTWGYMLLNLVAEDCFHLVPGLSLGQLQNIVNKDKTTLCCLYTALRKASYSRSLRNT